MRPTYDGLNLTVAGLATLLAGLVMLVLSTLVFGGVTEDVTQRNGLSTTDMLHLHWFTEHRTDALVSGSRVVSEFGSPLVLALAAIAAAVWLWMRGLRLGLALAPSIAFGIAATFATAMKTIVGRHRPPLSLHLVTENNASFPSGHATDSTAFFVALALISALFVLRRPVTRSVVVFGSGLLAGAVGISRLILGVHWPTDVVAGWALGLTVALVVTIAASLLALIERDRTPRRTAVARVLHMFDRQRPRPPSLEAA